MIKLISDLFSDFFPKMERQELEADTLSDKLKHVTQRTIEATAVTFSLTIMPAACFFLTRNGPQLSNLLDLMQFSAEVGLRGGLIRMGYAIGEFSRALPKTA